MGPKSPTHNSTHTLLYLLSETHRVQEPSLGRACLIVIALRVEIERGLYFRVPQKALHRLRLHLPCVHQPITKAVPEIVESEALSWRNRNSCFDRGRSQIVGNERRSVER